MKSSQDNLQIAAFSEGVIRCLEGRENGHEVVLALPLSRLIVKMVAIPKDANPVEFSTPILQKMSPFPDEPLTVSCETVRETENGTVVIAAALPESAADDIAETLDAAKLSVVRIDLLALGQLRGIWNTLDHRDGRLLILIRAKDCLSMVVLDGDQPSAIRAIVDTDDLKREVMLALLEAEDFGGARALKEILIVEPEGVDGDAPAASAVEGVAGDVANENADDNATNDDRFAVLGEFAPVRKIQVGADSALVGVAERADDPAASLNALPESWREVLEETRFKRKLVKYLAVAGGIWLLIMGILFGVPVVYGFMTDYQKGLSKQHARQYKAVKEMKAKVDLIHKYSDHARGALEIMKAISDRLPGEVTLSSWDYKREDGVRVRGDADTAEATYAFKDAMDAMADGEEGEGEPIFGSVILSGPNASKNKFNFNLDCQYKKEGEE